MQIELRSEKIVSIRIANVKIKNCGQAVMKHIT